MNAKTMLDRQHQFSVIFAAVDQVIRAIKQIKNEMKMRFFIIWKMYQILYKNYVIFLEFLRKKKHGVKVGPGPRDSRQSLKVGPATPPPAPLKFKSGTPGPPSKLKVEPHDPL